VVAHCFFDDYLIFSYYEYLAMLIINNVIGEGVAKSYFRPLLRDVYELFYYDSKLFDGADPPFREDYHYLRKLFRKWDMKPVCDSLFRK